MPTLVDTRDAVRQLQEEGGFSEEEARAIVDLFRDADEKVATRTDVERRLRTNMEAMEERLRRQLTTRIYGAAAFVTAVLGIHNYVMG